jgi:succinate dehydrogenase/fumarate reductase-like Fe-S protein
MYGVFRRDHPLLPQGSSMSNDTAPLPPFNGLSQHQQRGMDCVWCGVTLTASTAIDLGPRPIRILDHATRWFPRSCTSHRGDAAYKALLDHCADCSTCPEGCETGAQLRRAVREVRR